MSRTIIYRQCRSLSRTLPSTPALLLEIVPTLSRVALTRPTRRDQQSTPRRHAHTARAHAHSKHPRHSMLENEAHKTGTKKLKEDLRILLRDVAQPVAVVTSFMPPDEVTGPVGLPMASGSKVPGIADGGHGNGESSQNNGSKYHGATLSSFTSIAMDPFPLVAFALRIPSRMATTLSSLTSSTPSTTASSSTTRQIITESNLPSHMVINLLSASQASTAITFSRPDLYPTPFSSNSPSEKLQYTLNEDGLPVLHGVVGALACKLVGGPIPLHDLDYFSAGPGAKAKTPELNEGDVASELFIARIVRVERSLDAASESDREDHERTLPLVYHRRSYTSCHPRPSRINEKKR